MAPSVRDNGPPRRESGEESREAARGNGRSLRVSLNSGSVWGEDQLSHPLLDSLVIPVSEIEAEKRRGGG